MDRLLQESRKPFRPEHWLLISIWKSSLAIRLPNFTAASKYAEQFRAVRSKVFPAGEDRFIRSLAIRRKISFKKQHIHAIFVP